MNGFSTRCKKCFCNMNSTIASNINGGAVFNQQVANGSRSSLLLSSIDFSLSEVKTNFSPSSNQGRYLIKLTGKEELLNGQNRFNKENSSLPVSVNGNSEKSPEDSIPVPKVQLYSGKIHPEWRQVYKIGAGLNNLGNTCFMNTVIQCLTYCPPLANYLLHDNDHSSKCSITGFCMMCLLQRHLRRTIGKTGEVIKPVDIYQRLKSIAKHFQFGRQEDAHEFLRYIIDHLWKACLPPANNGLSKLDAASKETTVINKIFGGYHRSQVICLKCKKESNTFDHFMDFILDIKQNVSSLERALEKYIQPEILQQENCYQCPRCKTKVEAKKQFSVYQPPTVATFQLKRFDYNRTFGGKITKQISYPQRLNLRPYMSENKGEPVWYRLNAVLVHSGPSCNSGHYYCYVKNSNGLWYIMDDQRVSQVSLNQVLNENAYVLFYIKVTDRDKAPMQKIVDVKSSFYKGEVSNIYLEKNTESIASPNSHRTTPFGEKNNFTNASQSSATPNVLRKLSTFTTPNRERVSFGFRPGLSPKAFTPKNKETLVRKPSSAPVTATSAGGLVPYNEDSSDSSDAGANSQSASKTNGDKARKDPSSELKDKHSKSVDNLTGERSQPVSRVSVSGNWIATDATDTASCSSNNSSHWEAVAIDNDRKSVGATNDKDSKHQGLSGTSSAQTPRNFDPGSGSKLNGKPSSPDTNVVSRQNCPSNVHSPSLSKRKSYSDFDSKSDKDYSLSENGYVPSPKKTKFSVFSSPVTNGERTTSGKEQVSGERSSHNIGNGYTRTQAVNGNFSPNKQSKNSWHGNTHESPESRKDGERDRNSQFLDKHRGKNSYFDGFSSDRRKSPVLNHAKDDSLYGADVPTWKNENYHRPSVVPDYERRRSFDDYDEEYDRGKVRKFKNRDNYHYFNRDNPFQKHSERNQKHYKGKYYSNQYHHRKPYYSNSSWKSKNNYNRYRNHQRYY